MKKILFSTIIPLFVFVLFLVSPQKHLASAQVSDSGCIVQTAYDPASNIGISLTDLSQSESLGGTPELIGQEGESGGIRAYYATTVENGVVYLASPPDDGPIPSSGMLMDNISTYDPATNTTTVVATVPTNGYGFGGIAVQNDFAYVSNQESGMIQKVDLSTGAVVGTYDHGIDGRTNAGLVSIDQANATGGDGALPGRDIIAVEIVGNTMYYSVMANGAGGAGYQTSWANPSLPSGMQNEIWSVSLDTNGDPDPTTATRLVQNPPSGADSNPVGGIAVSNGVLYAATMGMKVGSGYQYSIHQGDIYTVDLSDNTTSSWVTIPGNEGNGGVDIDSNGNVIVGGEYNVSNTKAYGYAIIPPDTTGAIENNENVVFGDSSDTGEKGSTGTLVYLGSACDVPTAIPTAVPPTDVPTAIPTDIPPTDIPTAIPTDIPPTDIPTAIPTDIPPTDIPTAIPTAVPPTDIPTAIPTAVPPTDIPTAIPTAVPPTDVPTAIPTAVPPTAVPVFGSIGDRVFHDTNGNGQQDNGEQGLANVTVELSDTNGNTISTTTDSTGAYLFENLAMGIYVVSVDSDTLPDDKARIASADPENNGDGQSIVILHEQRPNDSLRDFGFEPTEYATGSIGNIVYHDSNTNGTLDGDDYPLPFVEVVLTDASGAETRIQTDENGRYLFDSLLLNNTYTVTVNTNTLPSDKLSANSSDSISVVALDEDNSNDLSHNFGFSSPISPTSTATPSALLTGSIGDMVVHDVNENGILDENDIPLSGVVVIAKSPSGQTYIGITNNDGSYLISGLPLGTYSVEVLESTIPSDKLDTPILSPSDNNQNGVVVLSADSPNSRNNDWLYAPIITPMPNTVIIPTITPTPAPILGEVSGYLWSDNDTLQSSFLMEGDTPLVDALVEIRNSDGDLIDIVATDDSGYYQFGQLPLGLYTVMVRQETIPSTKNGSVLFNAYNGTNGVISVELSESNPTVNEANVSFVEPPLYLGSVGDQVWSDTNQNGVFDSDDMPLGGVRVELFSLLGTFISDTVTNESGNYIFNNLPLSNYIVRVDEYTLPVNKQGNGIGDESVVAVLDLELQDKDDADFGYTAHATTPPPNTVVLPTQTPIATPPPTQTPDPELLGSIGNIIYHDLNNNGVQDEGENGLIGVTVVLTSDTGETQTTTTDELGRYVFVGLPSGRYTVHVDKSSIPDTKQGIINDNHIDDDSNDGISVIDLSPNQHVSDVDFGVYAQPTGVFTVVEKSSANPTLLILVITGTLFVLTGLCVISHEHKNAGSHSS